MYILRFRAKIDGLKKILDSNRYRPLRVGDALRDVVARIIHKQNDFFDVQVIYHHLYRLYSSPLSNFFFVLKFKPFISLFLADSGLQKSTIHKS